MAHTKGKVGKRNQTLNKYGLTKKQERFAQEFVATGNASQAYRAVYNVKTQKPNATHWNKASALLRRADVAARVRMLRDEAEERALETLAYSWSAATMELEEARRLAMDNNQVSAAVSAIREKIKLHGLDQSTTEDKAVDTPTERPSDVDIRVTIRERLERIAASLEDADSD